MDTSKLWRVHSLREMSLFNVQCVNRKEKYMMKILAMIIVVLTLTSCSSTEKKIDKFYWDPVKGFFRITYGVTTN